MPWFGVSITCLSFKRKCPSPILFKLNNSTYFTNPKLYFITFAMHLDICFYSPRYRLYLVDTYKLVTTNDEKRERERERERESRRSHPRHATVLDWTNVVLSAFNLPYFIYYFLPTQILYFLPQFCTFALDYGMISDNGYFWLNGSISQTNCF